MGNIRLTFSSEVCAYSKSSIKSAMTLYIAFRSVHYAYYEFLGGPAFLMKRFADAPTSHHSHRSFIQLV